MTSKELLYVEDALSHEQFIQTCSKNTSAMIKDENLSKYLGELEKKHCEIYNKFLNLL